MLVLAALGAAGTTESVVQQFLLLGKVLVVVADGRRGRGRTTCIRQLLPVLQDFLEVMLDEEPGTLVLRLILAPDDLRGVRIAVELGLEGLVRERIESVLDRKSVV